MKVICHAAGKSIECHPHTINRPAALLKALGQTVIQHNLSAFESLDEIIILKGFEADKICELMGDEFKGAKVTYVDIAPESSLEDCFKAFAGNLNDEDYLFMICEAVFSPVDIEAVTAKPGTRLVKDGQGCCLLHMTAQCHADIISGNKTVKDVAAALKPVEVQDYWFSLKYPWNYLEANVELVRRLEGQNILAEVETGATIKGPVFIGRDTLIKANSYIEGPVFIDEDCVIGPFAYIRKDTVIGKGVQLGRMEVFDSVLMDGFTSKHVSYAAHSVIGENTNFGAGTITADYRHDGGNHTTIVNGDKVETGRRKLGAFIGDNVHTAIGTLLYPGRKMWPGTSSLPGEVVMKDKLE